MKLSKILLASVAALLAVGCYNKFDMPEIVQQENSSIEAQLKAEGYEYISIADLKKEMEPISDWGSTNDNWKETMYKHIVDNKSQATPWERSENRYLECKGYIKGKVVSDDEEGNIYKSLFIYDGDEAIELKLTNGLFIDYPCQLPKHTTDASGNFETDGKTVWVYVKLPGLYMGNFRMMISLGDIPTEGYNSYGRYKCYPNSNIVSPEKVREHVILGQTDKLTYGRLNDDGSNRTAYDILEIDENNYTEIYGNTAYYGRLLNFKNIEMVYRGLEDQDGNMLAVIGSGTSINYYPAWTCTSGTLPELYEPFVNMGWGKLAYSIDNVALTSQFLAGYGSNPKSENSTTNKAGMFVVRISGYAKFANNYVPANGTIGSIMAVYGIYGQTTNEKNSQFSNTSYQVTPCRFEDIFPEYYQDNSAEGVALRQRVEEWAQRVTDGGSISDDAWDLPQQMGDEEDSGE